MYNLKNLLHIHCFFGYILAGGGNGLGTAHSHAFHIRDSDHTHFVNEYAIKMLGQW